MKRLTIIATFLVASVMTSHSQKVKLVRTAGKQIDVFIGESRFTSFLFPDSLEKPVLYPINASNGTVITRGYPMDTQPGDPTDHPHHLGLWFNFENVNGLDFWNNSFAIPKEKKSLYGWIKTKGEPQLKSGKKGELEYKARWTDQKDQTLLEERTQYIFSGRPGRRIIDRFTTLTAVQDVSFTDAKDGMLGLRLAHALQIPTTEDQKFTDDKGNVTIVKGGTDNVPTGNYLTSEGKTGNDAWSTRGKWCKVYGKMGNDSISVSIIDHPENINYPTFWHARGYGLFAANPLGEKIFTNGASARNLHLKKGESVTFRFRIVIENGQLTTSPAELDRLADEFSTGK